MEVINRVSQDLSLGAQVQDVNAHVALCFYVVVANRENMIWRGAKFLAKFLDLILRKIKRGSNLETCLLKHLPAVEHKPGVLFCPFADDINFCQDDNGMKS